MKAAKHERRKWRCGWPRQVIDLLSQRPDLRGMSSVADAVDEAVRWSA